MTASAGWSNRYEGCYFTSNLGDGLRLSEGSGGNNHNLLMHCTFLRNEGIGVRLRNSDGVVFLACCFGTNRQGAILVPSNVHGLSVIGCYFEANCETGYTFATPPANVKADIILNGGDEQTMGCSSKYGTTGVLITGCFVSVQEAYDPVCFVYGPGVQGAIIEGNALHPDDTLPLFGVHCDHACSAVTNVRIGRNQNFSTSFDVFGLAKVLRARNAYSVRCDDVVSRNLAQQDLGVWSMGPNGTWTQSGDTLNGQDLPVWSLTHDSNGTSSMAYFRLNAADYPSNAGKIFAFSAHTKADATDKSARLYCGLGNESNSNDGTTEWKLKIGLFRWPESGTLTFGVSKGGAAGTVWLAAPMLYEFGADWSLLFSQIPCLSLAEGNPVHSVTRDVVAWKACGLHIISSDAEEITGVLADGTKVGQCVNFVCKVAGNNIDIKANHHAAGDPTVIRLDAAGEWVELVWDGTDWVETGGMGQTHPSMETDVDRPPSEGGSEPNEQL